MKQPDAANGSHKRAAPIPIHPLFGHTWIDPATVCYLDYDSDWACSARQELDITRDLHVCYMFVERDHDHVARAIAIVFTNPLLRVIKLCNSEESSVLLLLCLVRIPSKHLQRLKWGVSPADLLLTKQF